MHAVPSRFVDQSGHYENRFPFIRNRSSWFQFARVGLIVAISGLLIVTPVSANDKPSGVEEEENWLNSKGFELDKLMVMLADPVMRDLVCQLANNRLSPRQLARSVGLQKTRDLLPRIEQL